jgi:type IV secretion system protein TrbI
VLDHAPSGILIDAAKPPAFHPPIPKAPTPTQAPQPDLIVPDDMTETALAARKAAWQAYYQELQDRQRRKADARNTAMGADTEVGGDERGNAMAADGTKKDQQPKGFMDAAASDPSTDYSPFMLTDPISQYELKASDQITAKLLTELNSDSPGLMKAVVTNNVLDHATGMHILIPAGSTLVGTYDTNVSYGQTRVTTAWTRIIYPPPCDQSLDLGAMPGADQTGQAGFEDITNNHLGKIFTSAILVSVFGAAAQLSQPQGNAFQSYSPVQSAAGAIGQQTSQIGAQFMQKGLNIPPTQKIRQGYNFDVFLTKDVAFLQPWVAGVCKGMQAKVAFAQ